MLKSKFGRARFLGLAIVGCMLVVSSSFALASGKELRVEGIVTELSVANGTVRLQTRGGMVVVSTSAATKIERNGRRATLAAFLIGDRAQARFATIPGPATKLEAVGP